ncbi:hypothetical protein C0991_007441 [Blastosporella zonata]|nr:hypothetical protein C0991_007441 [Blastosporella zonata]
MKSQNYQPPPRQTVSTSEVRNTAQGTNIAPTPRFASDDSNSLYKPSTAKPKKSSAPTPDEEYTDECDDKDGNDVDAEEGVDGVVQEREVMISTMYRCLSTSPIPVVEGTDPMFPEVKMEITLYVPHCGASADAKWYRCGC